MVSEPPQWEAQQHAQPHAQPHAQQQPLAPQEQPLSADTLGWGSPADMAGGVVPTSSFAPQPESARQIPGPDPTPPQPAPQPVRVDALPAAASSPTGWVESMDAKAALGFRLGFGSGFGFGLGLLAALGLGLGLGLGLPYP